MTCMQCKHETILTTEKQSFNIQLVRQVEVGLPLKNLKAKKMYSGKVSCVMQMCTTAGENIQPT